MPRIAAMLILLNGAFGSGKTTTARLPVQKLPGAVLYDPERVGVVVRVVSRPIETAGA